MSSQHRWLFRTSVHNVFNVTNATMESRQPTEPIPTATPSRWMWGWMLFAAWTIFAFASVLQVAAAFNQRGQSIPWRGIIPERLIDWYTCAIFTPVCFWLVRRYPLNTSRLRVAIPGYVLVISVCVALKCLLMVWIFRIVGGPPGTTFVRAIAQSFLFDLIVLFGVVAVIQVLELQAQSAQREQVALALRAQLSEAELQILKGQLQPHFLFNTLNGVASLIHTSPDTADFVVVQLADLLRASLELDGAREIPLSAELTLLDKYLAIMTARFQGRLAIDKEIEDAARTALVPQFLLQPLVENAFEHGIGRRAGAGRINIRAAVLPSSRLRLEVSDDGAGVATDAALENGVGLTNTTRRLERLYGEREPLRLSSLPGGGARVSVEIPFRTA